jgi:predicted anti-sigma-YlaC factor YlaD
MANTCREIEPLLVSYVDGAAGRDEARVVAHLATCASCRLAVDTQLAARKVLRARASHLSRQPPPGFQTRLESMLRAEESAAST